MIEFEPVVQPRIVASLNFENSTGVWYLADVITIAVQPTNSQLSISHWHVKHTHSGSRTAAKLQAPYSISRNDETAIWIAQYKVVLLQVKTENQRLFAPVPANQNPSSQFYCGGADSTHSLSPRAPSTDFE